MTRRALGWGCIYLSRKGKKKKFASGLGASRNGNRSDHVEEGGAEEKNAGRDDWNGGGGIWRMMWKTSSAKTS